MKHIMGVGAGGMFFTDSDFGWCLAHSYAVYAPLLIGCGTVIYEGKPHLPDSGAYWRIV